MEHKLDFTYGVLIPYINFFLFVGAFYFFFRKALATFAQSRREKYLLASKEASRKLAEAQARFDELNAKYQSLKSELVTFAKQSEAQALQDAERLKVEGEKLANQIREETRRLADEEVERAKRELRAEIVNAAKHQADKELKMLSADKKAQLLRANIERVSSVKM